MVLDAALQLFVKHGYSGTSMEAIAAAAMVTKPVVYECYPNKQELFRALLDREEARLIEAIATVLPAEVALEDLERLVTDGLTALLRGALDAPDSWRIVFDSEHGGEPAVIRRLRRSRDAIVSTIGQLVEPVIDAAGVDDAPRKAPVLAEAVASIGISAVRILLSSDGEWTPEELGSMLGRVIARGPSAA